MIIEWSERRYVTGLFNVVGYTTFVEVPDPTAPRIVHRPQLSKAVQEEQQGKAVHDIPAPHIIHRK